MDQRTPSDGNKTKPAKRLPPIAPMRFLVYSRVIAELATASDLNTAADNTGKVAPINVVGIKSTSDDKTKRNKLKTKKLPPKFCQINTYAWSVSANRNGTASAYSAIPISKNP